MRNQVFAWGLSLGLGLTILPTGDAAASRSDTRGSQSSIRQSSARPPAIRQASVRGGYSVMPRSLRAGNPRQSGGQSAGLAGRRGSSTYSFGGGISCVPYARSVTGMEISGNGRDWWHNAAGRYARSSRPEPGAILSFPSSGGMRSGHVAVVSRVINARLIEIDHANWGGPGIRRGSVMHGVDVMDVSPGNDWTEVRVQVGHSNDQFGREYPTHGFILNRPDDGGASVAYASYTGGYSRVSFNRGARPASRQVAAGGARHAANVRPALLHRASYQPARQPRR